MHKIQTKTKNEALHRQTKKYIDTYIHQASSSTPKVYIAAKTKIEKKKGKSMKLGCKVTAFLYRKIGFSVKSSTPKKCSTNVMNGDEQQSIALSESINTIGIGIDESNTTTVTKLPYDHVVTLRPEEIPFHCQTRIPAHEVKYSMVLTVTNSWEQDLKIIPNWDRIGGELLLRKMFELEPECIQMFGFPPDTKFDDPALSENDKFIKKGIALIIAVDVALTFLGPDLEPLEAQLEELGGRHVARLCKPKHWPMVGVALFHTLEVALGNKFTLELQRCWVILYNFLGYHMIQGLIAKGGPTWEDN